MTKEECEDFKNKVLEEYEKGNVVFMTVDGLIVSPLKDFITQPIDGLLYDLNRDKMTVLSFLDDPKWVNDYAVMMVITELKRLVDNREDKNAEKQMD